MKKRMLGFILSAAMVICLCAGCGADKAAEGKDTKTEKTEETKEEAKKDDAEEEAGDDKMCIRDRNSLWRNLTKCFQRENCLNSPDASLIVLIHCLSFTRT